MFVCDKCGKDNVIYDFDTKAFICPDCGYTEKIEGIEKSCGHCGHKYIEYTWFDPSGCECGKSFID